MLSTTKRVLKYFTLMMAVVLILVMLSFFYILPDRLDPQGRSSASCNNEALLSLLNSAGMIVTAHYTLCDDVVHDSAIYVYVHKSEEPESRQTLVFRYADYPTVAPPKIEWIDNSTLFISVGDVSQITKMLTDVEGVKIVYTIGKEEYPRDAWQKHIDKLKLSAAFIFALMLGLIYVCKKIVSSILKSKRSLG
jgi:hypothetical protein